MPSENQAVQQATWEACLSLSDKLILPNKTWNQQVEPEGFSKNPKAQGGILQQAHNELMKLSLNTDDSV